MEIITKENANEYDLNFGDHEYGKAVAASLKRELDKAHIPYQVDDKNQIHYEEKYREVIESLITKVLTETPE